MALLVKFLSKIALDVRFFHFRLLPMFHPRVQRRGHGHHQPNTTFFNDCWIPWSEALTWTWRNRIHSSEDDDVGVFWGPWIPSLFILLPAANLGNFWDFSLSWFSARRTRPRWNSINLPPRSDGSKRFRFAENSTTSKNESTLEFWGTPQFFSPHLVVVVVVVVFLSKCHYL